jgi:fumarate hydratase class II
MPGKVNPTQIEAITMVCAQVMGHDVAIGFAASQGHFELNVYKPLIASNILDSIVLLSDAMRSFTQHCIIGIEVNEEHVEQQVRGSLMLVTALSPHIGYDEATKIAKYAYANNTSLRIAALAVTNISEEQFDLWVNPRNMLGPKVNKLNED